MRNWLVRVTFALLAVGCASHPEPTTAERVKDRRLPPPPAREAEPPRVAATELARVPSVTFGPYLGLRPDGGLVVWAALGKVKGEREFNVVPLGGNGRPLSAARRLEVAPANLGLVAVRPLGAGYLIAYTRKALDAESLEVLCTSASGQRVGGVALLGSVGGSALWVESVATEQGALVFTAVRGVESKTSAELSVVPIDLGCRAGERRSLARDALAWQAIRLGRGALLALVRGPARDAGVVEALLTDASGALRTTVSVSAEKGADLDLDAVGMGASAVLVWTDQRALDPRLMSAALDENGRLLSPPAPLTPPEGEQTLVRLVPRAPGAERAFVAWETLDAGDASRRVQLSALSAKGRLLGARTRLDYVSSDGGVPEFAAIGNALAALTLAPECRAKAACAQAESVPTFVQFGPDLAAVAVEPLRLEPLAGKLAELGFGLGCTESGCFAIAAQNRTPAPVFAAELVARSKAFRAPVLPVDTTSRPRVVEHRSLIALDSIAAFAFEGTAEAGTLAALTDYDPTTPWRRLQKPAADGRYEPLRARLTVDRVLPAASSSEPLRASPISLRAHSLGGVALAATDAQRGEQLVAWAGLDQGEPQVFLSLLAKAGDKVNQRMLTRKKGALGDIAAVWVGDGWIVVWVDERSGDPEVYAAKVDPRLNRASPEQRISEAAGVAADLALAFDGQALRLVWSDSRAAELAGNGDIYSAALNPRDASRLGAELRLGATRAHSVSPALAPFQGGFAVAWLEAGDSSGASGSVALTTLSEEGGVAALVTLSSDADPRSIGLGCAADICHLAAVLEHDGQTELALSTWSPAAPVAPWVTALSLGGSSAASVAPVVRGDAVLFAASGADGARVRWARIAW